MRMRLGNFYFRTVAGNIRDVFCDISDVTKGENAGSLCAIILLL